MHSKRHLYCNRERGGILIALVAVIMILSVLGVVVMKLTSTSILSNVHTLAASNAASLAQSGFMYFAGQYKQAENTPQAKNSVISTLGSNRTFTLEKTQEQFVLSVQSYFFQANTTIAAATSIPAVTLSCPGTAGIAMPSTGRLAVFDGSNFSILSYEGCANSGSTFTFTNVSNTNPANIPAIEQGTSVFPAAAVITTEQTVSNINDSLTVEHLPDGFLPERFGMFTIARPDGSTVLDAASGTSFVYAYNSLEQEEGSTSGVLRGIKKISDPGADINVTVSNGDVLILHSFAKISSTGNFQMGENNPTQHEFSRMVAFGFEVGGNNNKGSSSIEWSLDPNNLLLNWDSEKQELAVDNTYLDGVVLMDKNAKYKGTPEDHILVSLDWDNNSPFPPDLYEARANNNNLLSYDVQIKFDIGVRWTFKSTYRDHFMVGLSFRLDETSETGYGISFFRSSENDFNSGGGPSWLRSDGFANMRNELYAYQRKIDDARLIDEILFIVLWRLENNSGGTKQFTLLDYMPMFDIPRVSAVAYYDYPYVWNRFYDESGNGQLVPFSTLMLCLEEKYDPNDSSNKINYISAYYRGVTDYFPMGSYYRVGTVHWDLDLFHKVIWERCKTDDYPLETETCCDIENDHILDSRFISDTYFEGCRTGNSSCPNEIGVHDYDDVVTKSIHFADFAIRVKKTAHRSAGNGIF